MSDANGTRRRKCPIRAAPIRLYAMHNEIAVADVFNLSPLEFVEHYNRRIAEDGAADINERIIADYRLYGRPTGIFSGAPILLLTTLGAKSGVRRTAPLVYTSDADRYVVVGSRAGGPFDPRVVSQSSGRLARDN